MRRAWALVVILLAGCPSASPGPAADGGGGVDGTAGGSDASDAAGGGPDAPPGAILELTCNADNSVLPPFARDCATSADCAIVYHQVDCCGTAWAYGIRADQLAEFAAAESACQALFPGCGCPPGPTIAQDGDIGEMGTIMATCQASTCLSFVP